MHIGFVTQWFPPEPAIVPLSIATDLASLGHEVDVVTGFPNYPSGRLAPGYPLRPYRRERPAPGVTVHRAPLYPSHGRGAAGRALNYLSFAAGASAVARAAVRRPDVWLVYSSPATAALPAARVLARSSRPMFLLIQDLWPDSVTDSGFVGGRVGELAERSLTAFCQWTYRRAAGVGVISPGMRTVLEDRGVPAERIHDTPNWIDDSHLHPDLDRDAVDRASLGLPEGPTWMYAGNLGDLQGLETLVEAFAKRPVAQLVLLGDGVARDDLRAQAQRLGATNVTFAPRVSTEEVGRYLAASDVQVVSLQDSPLLRVTMPSKVQAAMAAGRPILSHAAGDAAEVVTSAGAGWSAVPGDVSSVLDAIDAGLAAGPDELRRMGRAARAAFDARYSSRVGPARLAAALEAAVAAGRPPRD